MDLKNVGLPLVVVYVMADVGSIAGGWLSSALIKRGWSVNAGAEARAARLRDLASCRSSSRRSSPAMWTAVMLIGFGRRRPPGVQSNLYTLVSDTFPKRAVGSVAGLGGTFGYIGTTLFASPAWAWILGRWTNNNYFPLLRDRRLGVPRRVRNYSADHAATGTRADR